MSQHLAIYVHTFAIKHLALELFSVCFVRSRITPITLLQAITITNALVAM